MSVMTAKLEKPARYLTDAHQNADELAQFIEVLKGEQVRRYMEIGCCLGGTLWRIAQALGEQGPCKFVAIDMPTGTTPTQPHLEACIAALRAQGHEADLIIGDSTREQVIVQARKHAPFDAIFIDANHTLPYCTGDWQTYGPMARIVAFHDIGWRNTPSRAGKRPIEVPILWNKIKGGHRHSEIRLCKRDNGIGILWH